MWSRFEVWTLSIAVFFAMNKIPVSILYKNYSYLTKHPQKVTDEFD